MPDKRMMLTVQRKISHRATFSFYGIHKQDIEIYSCAKFHKDIIRFVAARGHQSWDFMLCPHLGGLN